MIESDETSVPLVFGSAVHGTVKHFYKRLMAGQRLSVEETAAAFTQDWEAQCCVPIKWNGTTPEQLQEQGIALVRAYMESISEPVIPIAVEQELRAPITNLATGETISGITIHGILDRVEPGNTPRPIELKTSAQSYSQFRTDISLQFSIYSYLIAYHHQAEEIDGDYEIMVKLKQPKVQRLTTRRNVRDFDKLYRTIQSVMRGIESNVFHPNPSHMFCAGCDLSRECRAW